MPPTIREVKTYFDSLRDAQVAQAAVNVNLLRAAELRAVKLTGSVEWDSFLQHCQALLDQADHELDTWLTKLAGALTENGQNGRQHCQLEYHSWKTRRDTIKEIMQRPALIMAESKKV